MVGRLEGKDSGKAVRHLMSIQGAVVMHPFLLADQLRSTHGSMLTMPVTGLPVGARPES